ncbi:hypothetical protein PIB30_020493 [Stylosanthes scabra]|uniref:Cupredoxin n=1 Tax=Stylosanthes scabra TaxID=79078 RepID=A0ABU6W8Q3_9FABA|nr:hypothetical protein [Stylosanthes scabra]
MSCFPIFLFFLLQLLFKPSHSTTIVVDGSSQWKNPIVHIGDSIVFKHKQHFNLYIFKNQEAFNNCNFTQATPLTNSYTWHPSRPGFFYFTFNNGSLKSCQESQKLAIKVVMNSATAPQAPPTMAPEEQHSPKVAPSPSSGGEVVSSSPAYPWPFRPHQAASPSPSPVTIPLVPDKGGAMPFINSNPAVPLPTGEVDSATIRPLPTSSTQSQVMMIGSFGFHIIIIAVHTMTLLLMM